MREPNLTLAKTDEVCHAAESMQVQMKVVGDGDTTLVHAIKTDKPQQPSRMSKSEVSNKPTRDCWNCGQRHQFYKKDLCPAYGKKCNKFNSLQMRLVSYLDNNELNKPNTGDLPVFAVDIKVADTVDQLIKQYPDVFSPGIGQLDGEYHIHVDDNYRPIQHAPRRVPVAIREQLKETLTQLTNQDIIQPVTEPTQWISSMVVVPKRNGSLCICLDPKDLNRAIQCHHYPLPTIEDIAT